MDRLWALSVFKAVAENGSFVGAASALEISCPAVTRSVQHLESLLGARLLHRTTRRLALTAVGEDVLRRARGLLQSYEELASIGRSSASEPVGLIRMAAPTFFARHFLGPALGAFRARYPQVQVDLQLCEGPINLAAEEVDLALCTLEDLRPTQIALPLAVEEVGIYAAPGYLARKGEPICPSQLDEHDCLTSKAWRAGINWSFEHLDTGALCTVNVKVALQSNHIEMLADAAAHGAGIVMLPRFMTQAAVAQGQLRRILQDWCASPLSLQLAYSSRRNQPMSVRKLIEQLVETLGPGQDICASPVVGIVNPKAHASDAIGRAESLEERPFRQASMLELAEPTKGSPIGLAVLPRRSTSTIRRNGSLPGRPIHSIHEGKGLSRSCPTTRNQP